MKMKKKILLIVSMLFCVILAACAGNSTAEEPTSQPQTEFSITNPIEEIKQAEYIDVEDAIQKLESVDVSDEEKDFQAELTLLRNCSGRFVQQSEDSKNLYTADVNFYLSKGEIYCSIDYNGYIGEIADGIVTKSAYKEYQFESFPVGDLYGRKQDFKIYFGNEELYISWADICEYTLTRGDGSAENAQEYRENLKESGLLDVVTSKIDSAYENCAHNVVYDESCSSLYVYIQVADSSDNLRANLKYNRDIIDTWQRLADIASSFSKVLYDILDNYVYHVYFYIIDELNPSNSYTNNEILLQIDNGTILYNVCNDNAGTDYSNTDSTIPNGDRGHVITSGERNALETAKSYLSFTAFSYSGLVEQLEYEGYTASEASYAADHCGADWNQQAVNKAKEYLDFMSFSKEDLIEQLEYEGFTNSQALYGVENAY